MEPNVTSERLTALLASEHESSTLDFKSTFEPTESRSWVELAKDVGAMLMDGGYIVIGANERGVPSGQLDAQSAKQLDEATLRKKLKKWIAEPFEIRSAVHEINGSIVALIFAKPHEDGFCIFKADGAYAGNDRPVFRAGDVFARHGTASERWQQSDIQKIRNRLRQRSEQKDRASVYKIAIPRTMNVVGQCQGMLRDLPPRAKTNCYPGEEIVAPKPVLLCGALFLVFCVVGLVV